MSKPGLPGLHVGSGQVGAIVEINPVLVVVSWLVDSDKFSSVITVTAELTNSISAGDECSIISVLANGLNRDVNFLKWTGMYSSDPNSKYKINFVTIFQWNKRKN